MRNIFKQFEEWVTLLNRSDYAKAIFALTVKYTLGVFVILAIFNFLVYSLFSNSIETPETERIEHTLVEGTEERIGLELEEDQTVELESSLVRTLVISDGLILILTFFMAYLLSKRTLAPLEENHKKQTRFIADAAHEFRTPLAVMQAGSEVVLRSHRTIPEYEKFINESLDEVKRLTVLSNNLLFLAHNNKRRTHLNSSVSLSEICEKQVAVIKAYADSKSVSIKISSEDDCKVTGNKDDLTRLVINLLKNAIDYNRIDGAVKVSLQKVRNQIHLVVEDTGMGISEENLPHIFERFYKADIARSQTGSGTGLGLAIVKEIVTEHHGLVKVTSILGKGTTFKVILPSE